MALSTEQVYLLNTISYFNTPGVFDIPVGTEVGDIAQNILNNQSLQQSLVGDYLTPAQLESTCNSILADPQISQMTLQHVSNIEGGGDQMIFTDSAQSGGQEAVVVFEGTLGGKEWYDDAIAGAPDESGNTVSPLQQKALDWYESNEVQSILENYDNVTVSGHSKGGNKAKLITILNDNVDQCVSFDGQGYSDEFIENFHDEIAANQHKIQNHNNADDYVNILLNDVGETYYYEGEAVDDPMVNHSLFTLHQLPFSEHEAPQNPLLKELDNCLNGYLRTLNQKEKRELMDFTGDVLRDFLGGGSKNSDRSVIPGYIYRLVFTNDGKLIVGFISYIAEYAFDEAVINILQWIKDTFPFLDFLVDDALAKAKAKSKRNKGKDLKVSPSKADQIRIDTDVLYNVSSALRSLRSELKGYAGQIGRCAAQCRNIFLTVSVDLSIASAPRMGVRHAFTGDLAEALGRVSSTANTLCGGMDSLNTGITTAINTFEEAEKEIAGMFPTIDIAPFI